MATELLPNKENYYVYTELSNTGRQVIHTKDINMINWKDHLDAILNIMKDGIETEFVQNMFINDAERLEKAIFGTIPKGWTY